MSDVGGITDRLVEVRRRRRWPQAEMARRLGLTEEAYRALEKGRTVRLEWQTFVLLLGVLAESGISLDWFFLGVGRPPPEEGAAPEAEPSGIGVGKMETALEEGVAKLLQREAAKPPPLPRIRPRRRRGRRRPVDVEAVPVHEASRLGALLRPDGTLENADDPAVLRLRLSPNPPPGSVGVLLRGAALPIGMFDGDVLVCAPGEPPAGRPGLVVLKSREVLAAHLTPVGPGHVRISPLDAEQSVRFVTTDQILLLYTVVLRLPADRVPPAVGTD
jgi:transcriptional regulator with XRE-family HTH domain